MGKIVYMNAPPETPPQELAHGGGPPHDGDMELRVAKLEVHLEHIRGDIAAIKAQQIKTTDSVDGLRRDQAEEFKQVRGEASGTSWKLLGAGGAAFVVLLGAMAAGFKWF